MAPSRPSVAAAVLAAATAFLRPASAQNPGTSTPEVHPALTTYKCTTSGGCVSQSTSVVLDWNYRWIHTSSSQSCVTNGAVSTSLCPDEATCAQNCVVEGANYTAAGVATSGSTLTMHQYVNGQGASPRIYLLGSDGNYVNMQLLGQELTFDVDLSTLPCGENGALYLSSMDMTGYRSSNNQGGANYGNGYCDAQGPVQGWWHGVVNRNSSVSACNEMDILEANSQASAFTPHPCASDTSCDKGGCGYNAYAQGYKNYWAPGGTLDTSRTFTVTTQFITSDGSKTGTLAKINRQYIQDGKVVASAAQGGDYITDSWCNAQDGSNSVNGGLATMGRALGQGMVLVFSIWNDNSQYMNWLDSGSSGPCSSSAGNPSTILQNNPDTHVVFSNIKWGDIGSTYGKPGGSSPPPSSTSVKSTTTKGMTTSTTKAPPPVTTSPPPSNGGGPTQTHWGQCGGSGYSGPTKCASPYACQTQNPWYAQCL